MSGKTSDLTVTEVGARAARQDAWGAPLEQPTEYAPPPNWAAETRMEIASRYVHCRRDFRTQMLRGSIRHHRPAPRARASRPAPRRRSRASAPAPGRLASGDEPHPHDLARAAA